jgi:signal transduction histidine kinase
MGMDDETKKRLFTSVFSTKGGKGTGLGLLTTQKIIQEHQGTIAAQSEKGKGSTFIIELPKTEKIMNKGGQ